MMTSPKFNAEVSFDAKFNELFNPDTFPPSACLQPHCNITCSIPSAAMTCLADEATRYNARAPVLLAV